MLFQNQVFPGVRLLVGYVFKQFIQRAVKSLANFVQVIEADTFSDFMI